MVRIRCDSSQDRWLQYQGEFKAHLDGHVAEAIPGSKGRALLQAAIPVYICDHQLGSNSYRSRCLIFLPPPCLKAPLDFREDSPGYPQKVPVETLSQSH